jgi:hypothetical protein
MIGKVVTFSDAGPLGIVWSSSGNSIAVKSLKPGGAAETEGSVKPGMTLSFVNVGVCFASPIPGATSCEQRDFRQLHCGLMIKCVALRRVTGWVACRAWMSSLVCGRNAR